MLAIDFRVRPPFKGFLDLQIYGEKNRDPDGTHMTIFALNRAAEPSYDLRSMDAVIGDMDDAGISHAVVMSRVNDRGPGQVSLQDLQDLQAAYPGRFIGFAGIDCNDVTLAVSQVSAAKAAGMAGVALEPPSGTPPLHHDDDRLNPVFELCDELGLIVSLTASVFIGPDLEYSNPVHIHRVAKRFPKVSFVIPHACWPWAAEICGIALQCPNVYLAPDFYLNVPDIPGAHEYVRAANTYLSHRLLYASSFPVRPLKQSLQDFRRLPFRDDAVLERCLRLNAEQLLGSHLDV